MVQVGFPASVDQIKTTNNNVKKSQNNAKLTLKNAKYVKKSHTIVKTITGFLIKGIKWKPQPHDMHILRIPC